MSKIKGWKKTVNRPDYIVWSLPRKPMHNPFDLVVRTEGGKWITFIDIGSFGGGTRILHDGGTKKENVRVAIDYMRNGEKNGN